MSSALLIWRHPEQTIELSVAGRRERMWTIEVNGLASEHVHRLVFTCELVVRQVWMKIQRRDIVEKTKLVDVPEGTQRSYFIRAFHHSWAQSVGVVYWNIKRLHQRASILPKALLARHEPVTVMKVFHLTLR